MTATSDLDLIVIYDAEGAEASTGKRPLAVSAYYARLTQALIAALTAPMAEGILYKVDMRLRPSGQSGPLATSLAAFRRYQAEEAWTWEHMALTRARVVAGPPAVAEAVAAAIAEVLAAPARRGEGARRRRRHAPPPRRGARGRRPATPGRSKLGPGRMMDIELLAQTGALLGGLAVRRPRQMLDRLGAIGWLARPDAALLGRTPSTGSHTLQQIGRLASDHTIDPAEGGDGLVRLVLARDRDARPRHPAPPPRRGRRARRRDHRRAAEEGRLTCGRAARRLAHGPAGGTPPWPGPSHRPPATALPSSTAPRRRLP